MYFNKKKARPEDLKGVFGSLKKGEEIPPHEIVKRSGLTMTAVYGAITELENTGKIKVKRQNKTPKMLVSLPV